MESEKTRIPTIPAEIEYRHDPVGADGKIVRYPTEADKKAVIKRIRQTRDIFSELDRIGVDIQELAHLIALTSVYKEDRRGCHVERVRARDNVKKVVHRWEDKAQEKYDRRKHLEVLTETVSRKGFADDNAERFKCLTKGHPYLDRFVYDLKRLFDDKTPRPYRYMGAICSLFGLHFQNFCGECKYLDHNTAMCKKTRIFTCPKHKKARDKIRKKISRIGNQVPTARYPL